MLGNRHIDEKNMEKERITMKKTYKIEVDCAACAAKMEEAANRTNGIYAAEDEG